MTGRAESVFTLPGFDLEQGGPDTPLQFGQFAIAVTPPSRDMEVYFPAWSFGLKWVDFEHPYRLSDNDTMPSPGCEEEWLEAFERPFVEPWLAEDFEVHSARHAAALHHGLSPGGDNDLPTERILIDRELKRILDAQNVDIHDVAEVLSTDSFYLRIRARSLQYTRTYSDGMAFVLRQTGFGLPELSAWVPLRGAIYCGHAIEISEPLPETISAGVVGRRLGDLVATGVPELDARRITSVITFPEAEFEDHWASKENTRILLEPDHVEIGPCGS